MKAMFVLILLSNMKAFGTFSSTDEALRYGDAHFKGLRMIAVRMNKVS